MRHLSFVLLPLLAAACAGTGPETAETGLDLALTHRGVPGATNVVYDLTVYDTTGAVLWNQQINSADYGTADGAASFVGACDASGTGLNTLVADVIAVEPFAPSSWSGPGPLTTTFTCLPQGDTHVDLEFLLALQSDDRGFVDLTLDTTAISCSAKLDCRDGQGQQPQLVVDPNDPSQRLPTTVLAVTCDAGDPTWLYGDGLLLSCDDGTTVLPMDVGYSTGHPLNVDAMTTSFTQNTDGSATLGMQIGWNPTDGIPAGCSLWGRVAASDTEWTTMTSPASGPWPTVEWSIDLTDAVGDLTCFQHGLGDGTGVDFGIAGLEGPEFFPYQFPEAELPEDTATGL